MVEITAGLWAIEDDPPEYPSEDAIAQLAAAVEREDADDTDFAQVVRRLGPSAVIEPPDEEYAVSDRQTISKPAAEPRGIDRVRRRITARLWTLDAAARRPGDPVTAREASEAMLAIMLAAVPDRRGKSRRAKDHFTVRRHCYQLFFWLVRASQMLPQWKWSTTRNEKLRSIAITCGLEPERFAVWFRNSDNGPEPLDSIAMDWTADDLGLEATSVRKIVKWKARLK